jgi:hypothetical protein
MPTLNSTSGTERSSLSLSNPRIRVKAGDNWLVPGRKGSGKTYFGKKLVSTLAELYPYSRIYVLDIKMRDFQNWPGIVQSERAPAKPGSNERIQVWQPVIDDPDEIERWLYMVRRDPPAILQIDELLALCYGKRDTSEEFTRITKLGRALPITTIAQTQELVNIPRGALSQPDHVARFRLKHPYERRFINTILGSDITEPSDEHGFWYANADVDGEVKYYDDVTTFLGKKEK